MVSLARQRLKITMRIHFLKANGSHSTKAFAVADGEFDHGERVEINKRQVFKPLTTRVLYPGTHYVDLIVNGMPGEKRTFELIP